MRLKELKFLTILLIPLLILVLALGGCAKGAAKKPGVTTPGTTPGTTTTPGTQTKAAKKLQVTGFYVEKTMGPGSSYDSMVRNAKYIDVVSPLWYTVKTSGTIKDSTDSKAVSFAHQNGIKMVPLVNVARSNDEVLTSPAIRDKVIAQLVALVKKHNLDGVNIDFEFIPEGTKDFVKDKDLLTDFMSRLNKKLKPMGKMVNMSVIPHFQVSTDIGGIYDYRKLAPYVDVVTIMLYDRHQAGSTPGPISPLDWVRVNIEDAIKEGFRPEQICVGVATYGYDWPISKSGGFSKASKEILAKAHQEGIDIKWSDKYHEPYYIYHDPTTGTNREVWFESPSTLPAKVAIAKKYNVKGICIWRLGFETPSFWTEVGKTIGTKK